MCRECRIVYPPSSVSSSPCDLKQTGTTYALGLIRIDNELVVSGPYVVEPSAIGSVIGPLALEDRAVTDVGPDASARHLRIFTERAMLGTHKTSVRPTEHI